MEKLDRVEVEKALKAVRAKVRQIKTATDAGKRQPLYGLFEELQHLAHDAKQMVANGGKWADFHSASSEKEDDE